MNIFISKQRTGKTIKSFFSGMLMLAFVIYQVAMPLTVAYATEPENNQPAEKINICHKMIDEKTSAVTWKFMDTPAGPSLDGHKGHGDFEYTGGNDVSDKDAWCTNNAPPTPVDLCPNIVGVQETLPEGKEIVHEQCVDIVAPTVTVAATKVICDAEEFLPNWGAGGHAITATTADDWVRQSDGKCHTDPSWQFEWSNNGPDGGAATIGHVADYTTFTGSTSIPITGVSELHLREVLQSGYIPFTGQNTDQSVSAEFYCDGDALNYDNWDFIRNPVAGTTYNCVGFNAPVVPVDQCDANATATIVSDTTTTDEDGNAVALSYIHPAWTASIPDATWIWATNPVTGPTDDADLTKTFTKTFTIVGTPTGGTLDIAADNNYSVKVNGTSVPVVFDQNNFQIDTQDSYNIGSLLVSGLNTIEIKVTNLEIGQDAAPANNPAGLLYKVTLTNNECVVPPPPIQKSTVTMCKTDDAQPAKHLSGWTLMLKGDTVQSGLAVPSTLSAGVTSDPLVAGASYIAEAMGTWLNQGGANPVDTEYSTTDGWATHMDGYTGYQSDILELQIDNKFDPLSNWGTYNSLHKYAQSFVPATTSSNFRIFDGSGTTQNESWFGDNSGLLSVDISKGYAGVTGEDGCVTFDDVPYGTYNAGEVMRDGWTNVSGTGTVTVNDPTETFIVVNHDDSIPVDPKGSIEITKYVCPANTTVLRSANGVGGTVPEGCNLQEGKTFGYVYGTQTDANSPYPELAGPYVAGGATGVNGKLTIANLPATGRYLVSETNSDNQKIADGDILGLYCEGDGDTSANNDNQELTFVPNGGVAHCVAYNKTGDVLGETASNNTTVVKAADLAADIAGVIAAPTKWFFYNDETDVIDNNLGSFVTGPSTAPAGTGSAQMSVTGTQRRNIATYQFKNVKLADIKTLSFSTYSQLAGDGASGLSERAPYLNFNVDFNNTDTWQKRLVYVPGVNGVVTPDTWQSWDAIDSGNALWLYSGTTWPTTATPGTTPKTWAQILVLYPNAETRSTDSWFGFRVGEPYADGFTGNVDKFAIGIKTGLNTHTETYDFEPTPVVSQTQCSDGVDNADEEDSLIDSADPACHSDKNVNNSESYTSTTNSESNPDSAQCSDGISNDADGLIDSLDPGCLSGEGGSWNPNDNNETDTPALQVPTGGGGGGAVILFNTPAPVTTGEVLGASTSCGIYLDDFMKRGWKNNKDQVKKLQMFLNDYLNLKPKIPVNGVFGPQTYKAVVKFQQSESDLVLRPWVGVTLKDATKGTGFVYKTTITRINNIMCPELNIATPAAVLD